MRLVALLALPIVCTAHAQDLGPISVRNERALIVPFLRISPFHEVLVNKERRLEASWQITNDIKNLSDPGSPSLEEDHETMRLGLVYRLGLPNDAELAIESSFNSRGGGFLDWPIDWWHQNVLGWKDPVRDGTPHGRSIISVPGVGNFGSASGLGDTSIRYTRRIDDRYTGAVAIKVPTGSAD